MTSDPDFDAFYREMYPRLWAFLMRTTRDPAHADEFAQESFIRLLASRGAALPGSERRSYLFRIAENLVRDAARRRSREKTMTLDEAPEPAAPCPPEAMSRRAAAALARLGDRERKLLWLAYVEECRHAEIAEILGLAAGSVRVLLHRARRRFQEILAAEEK